MAFEYIDKIVCLLKEIDESEKENITALSEIMAKKIEEGNSIFIFGASHAGIIAQEVYYRAGGLAVMNPIFGREVMLDTQPITFTSTMENVPGYGSELVKKSKISKDDLVIIHSVSGRNAIVIDFAITAKEKGAYVCAITNLSYTKQVSSRHAGGKNLYEYADLVIDNHGELGDACVEIEGTGQKVTATSTISSIAIVNSSISEACKIMAKHRVDPLPIFYSANMDGGKEKNLQMVENFKSQMHYEF